MPTMREVYNDQFVENEWAHYLICRIDTTKNVDVNLATLLNAGIKKKPLIAVITSIKSTFVTKYAEAANALAPKKAGVTKSDLFNQLITFVKFTLGHLCLKCDAPYFPYSEANRSDGDEVLCFLCSLPAHKDCIKVEDINKDIGLVFMCQHCLLHKGKDDVLIDDQTTKPPPAKEEDSESTDETSSDTDTDSETDSRTDNRNRKKKTSKVKTRESEDSSQPQKRICTFYAKGICKYGRSGTRNGKCRFNHPTMCKPYQQYGRKGPKGCRGDCNLWHPKLCYKGLDYGECLNDACKFWHTIGVNRKRESDGLNQQHTHPPSQNNMQYTQSPQIHSRPNNSEGTFLDSLKSEMNQMVRNQQEVLQKQMAFYMNQFMNQMHQQMQIPAQRPMQHMLQTQNQVPVQVQQIPGRI